MEALALLLCAIIGYLLGSFSTGLALSLGARIDIRKLGSKSTGATNVTRLMGPMHGLATFVGDMLKAALAVMIAWLISPGYGGLVAGLFAIIGHNWPIYYKFEGGKGIACSVAVLLLNAPMESAIACAITLAVIALTRYVSLGSLSLLVTAALLLPFTRGMWPWGVWGFVLLLLGAYRHRANIQRLLKGEESKFTGGKQAL